MASVETWRRGKVAPGAPQHIATQAWQL